MQDHVKILAVIHIVFGALGLIGALVVLLVFGGIATFVGAQAGADARIAVPIVGAVGGVIALFILAISIPGIIAGIGLLRFREWARVLGIVISALDLLHVPIGTIVGAYGLWVLLNNQTVALFQPAASANYGPGNPPRVP
jgi:hypothetical protein